MNNLRSHPRKKITAEKLLEDYRNGCRNFSHVNLAKANLSHTDLSHADLSYANLQQIKFKGSNLQQVNLSGAKLRGVDFSKANLTGANFNRVDISNRLRIPCLKTKFNKTILSETSFTKAKLRHIDFSQSCSLNKVNFHRAELQKANFKKLELTESDFSYAKLYGTNFSETELIGADFQHSKAGISFNLGLSLFKAIVGLFASYLIVLILSLLFYGFLLYDRFSPYQTDIQYFFVFTYLAIVIVGFCHFFCASIWKNMDEVPIVFASIIGSILLILTEQPILNTLTWGIILVSIVRILQILREVKPLVAFLFALLFLLGCRKLLYNYHQIDEYSLEIIVGCLSLLIPLMFFSVQSAIAITEIELITGWGKWMSSAINFVVTMPTMLLLLGWLFFIELSELTDNIPLLIILLFGIIFVFLHSLYLASQTIKDRPNYRIIRDLAVVFCHASFRWFGGFTTRFRGSNLTSANFSDASLKNADFEKANLTHAIWYHSRQLQYARFGGKNYLRYPKIRQLVTQRKNRSRSSQSIKRWRPICRKLPKVVKKFVYFYLVKKPQQLNKNFDNYDLRGIRLSPVRSTESKFNLANASFEGSDLRYADLRHANLRNVNFVDAQLDRADLSGADLTGACIQGCQITEDTKFERVRCKELKLEKQLVRDIEPVNETFESEFLDLNELIKLITPDRQTEKLDELKKEFAKLDSIRNKLDRKYHLIQNASYAKSNYGIKRESYYEMFDNYRRQKVQAQRRQSQWQSLLWFKIEPCIEKLNHLTQELDIFPLLENLGRLSILIAVITFVNAILKPDVDLEKQYRPWEMIHSDTNTEVKGISRQALEQLQAEGASLENLQAPNVDLSRINLSNVNLSHGNLSGAILRDADFRGADLSGADLSGANLRRAKFDTYRNEKNKLDSLIPDIWKQKAANLSGANLSGADLSGAYLDGANLDGANLDGANLSGADLSRAYLSGADLSRADLGDAILIDADFTPSQTRSACYWDRAIYKGNYDLEKKEWIEDEEANQEYINNLRKGDLDYEFRQAKCKEKWE